MLRKAEIDLNETALIRKAQIGDSDAWTNLVLCYQEPLFRFAYLRLGDAAEAKDIVQEGFIRAYQSLERFDPDRPLKPWLFQIVVNLIRNRQRALSRYWAAIQRWGSQQPIMDTATPALSQQIDADQLYNAVQTLKAEFQEMIYLRYFLDMSVSETAEVLNIASGTVKSRTNRALQQLKGIIERDYGDLIA